MSDRVLALLGTGIVPPDTPVLRADDFGVLRGDGCFETMRVADGTIDAFDAHLTRLARSARSLGLPSPDLAGWRALADDVVAAWTQPGEAILRFVLTRGVEGEAATPTGYALMSPLPDHLVRQRRDGIEVLTLSRGMPADAHARAPWLLGGVKTTSYAVNLAAQRYAQALGADDVLFVSTDGQVLEGPTSTVVWTQTGDTLCTTPTSLGILAGTTVQTLFGRAYGHGFDTAVRPTTVDDLQAATGLWLVSSVRGAVRVRTLDGRPRADDGGLTARVQAVLDFPVPR